MEAVNAEIDSIIQLGKSWGMSDKDISECLLTGSHQTGEVKPKKPSPPTSLNVCSSIVTILKWTLYIVMSLFIIMAILSTLLSVIMTTSPQLDLKIQGFVTPYIFPTMRLARIFLKPVADYFKLEGMYSAECVIFNPFYSEEVPDCEPCQKVEQFAVPNLDDPANIPQLIADLTPFIYEDFSPSVRLEQIQKIYHDNSRRFTPSVSTMVSNLPEHPNITQLMKMSERELVEISGGYGQTIWKTGGVATAQAIRKLFPRPYFLPPEAEVSLGKTIVLSGPNAAPYEFGQESFALLWYFQASGSKKLTLFPHPDCSSDCKVIERVLHAGDLVFSQDQFWRVSMSPSLIKEDSETLSISFLSSFSF